MKILIIQQKMIGDVLTSSILFEALKSKYCDYELHYLVNSHTFPVVENNPYIDKFVFFTPEIEKSKLQLFKFALALKKEKYDVVIDVYSKLSSNIITLFSAAKIKISKHKSYTSFFYNYPIKYYKTPKTLAGLAIENRLQLLEPLGIRSKEPYKPEIYLTNTEKENAKTYLNKSGINLEKPLFMISVLGSGSNKTYPFNYMASILNHIVAKESKTQIVFNYIPKQAEDAKAIFDLCDQYTQKSIYFKVFGKSLREFLAMTSFCTALIGNEGGAVNMAKALSIPTFTIFSPWIDKSTWNTFEDKKRNNSVHLKDFKPGIYQNKTEKQLKPKAFQLYEQFLPEFITPKLSSFISNL